VLQCVALEGYRKETSLAVCCGVLRWKAMKKSNFPCSVLQSVALEGYRKETSLAVFCSVLRWKATEKKLPLIGDCSVL